MWTERNPQGVGVKYYLFSPPLYFLSSSDSCLSCCLSLGCVELKLMPCSLSPMPCQDATRMASAGCLAELCAFLSDDELSTVLYQHLLGKWSCLQEWNRFWKQGRFLLSHWFKLTLWLNLCSVFSCAFLCSWFLICALQYTGSTGNWLSFGIPRLFSLDLLSDDLIKVLAWLSNCCCQHEDSWTWQDIQAGWTGQHCDRRLADANCRPHLMAAHAFGELTNLPLS